MNDKNQLTEVLTDINSLRDFIRFLWQQIKDGGIQQGEALALLDMLSEMEIKGACRGEIMDVLDKASISAGGKAPTITVESYDKLVVLPESDLISKEDSTGEPTNIIHLLDIKRE